jgi:hypothetical protein
VGQAALTVLINGPGTISLNPSGNFFSTNQTVQVTAAPLAGQGFVNWTGDLTGTQNPFSVPMTENRTITANFVNWPVLVANQAAQSQGFRFNLLSGTGLIYKVQASANLHAWTDLSVVTNTTGSDLFIDFGNTNFSTRFYRAVSWP